MPSDFDLHQAETAKWMGYPDAAAMNRDHDRLHVVLCRWLGLTSHSMRAASNEPLAAEEKMLADLEENAVLHVQRFMQHAGATVPETDLC